MQHRLSPPFVGRLLVLAAPCHSFNPTMPTPLQVVCKPGSIRPHKRFKGEIYALSKEEGGRHTPFFTNYKPQFFFRTADVTGAWLPGRGVAGQGGAGRGRAGQGGCLPACLPACLLRVASAGYRGLTGAGSAFFATISSLPPPLWSLL